MTSTAPAGLSDYVPDDPDEDDPARQRIEDWHHKRTRALANGDWLPPPLLGGLFRTVSNGEDSFEDRTTNRSPFVYPPLVMGRSSRRHYRSPGVG